MKKKIWQEDEGMVNYPTHQVLWAPLNPHLALISPEIGVHKRNFKKIKIYVVHLSIYRQMVCIKINNYLIQH